MAKTSDFASDIRQASRDHFDPVKIADEMVDILDAQYLDSEEARERLIRAIFIAAAFVVAEWRKQ